MRVAITGNDDFWRWLRDACDTVLDGRAVRAVSEPGGYAWVKSGRIEWVLSPANPNSALEQGVSVSVSEPEFAAVPEAVELSPSYPALG